MGACALEWCFGAGLDGLPVICLQPRDAGDQEQPPLRLIMRLRARGFAT
jgi:hypothetical protein